MADTPPPLAVDTSFDPKTGTLVEVEPGLARLTAPNAGPYTFTGTNTFLIGDGKIGVLDPGPDDPRHREALRKAIAGRPVEAILLTHTHRDHSALAARLKAETGAPLWFAGPHRLSRPPHLFELNALAGACDWRLMPDLTFFDGEQFTVGGVGLTAVATPGHCANHLCYALTGTDTMLSGDHVMGWNSTLVAVPDGSMADYLASLRKVIALPYRRYLPAHGGPIADGIAVLAVAADASRIAQPAGCGWRECRSTDDQRTTPQDLSDAGGKPAIRCGADVAGACRVSRRHRTDPNAARIVRNAAEPSLTVVRGRRWRGCAQHRGDLVVEIEHEGLDARTVLAEIGEVGRAKWSAWRWWCRRARR